MWEALHPAPKRQRVAESENQVGQLVPPEIGYGKPPEQTKGFAAETAAITGESKRDVNRNNARAEAIKQDNLPAVDAPLASEPFRVF